MKEIVFTIALAVSWQQVLRHGGYYETIYTRLLRNQRPITQVEGEWNFDAMLDTGALFPIWIAEEKTLIAMGAKLKIRNGEFGGFNEKHRGNVYVLPYIRIGDLIYPEFHMIACKAAGIPAHLLLPATMFQNLIYEVNTKSNFLTITAPDDETTVRNLNIENSKGILHVLCNSVKK